MIKVGSKVKIKDFVKSGGTYNGCYVNDGMISMRGGDMIISAILEEKSEGGAANAYMINGSPYGWTDDIIELL